MKRILLPLLAMLIGLAAVALLLEVALRFLPVNQVLGSLPVNQDNPVLRYKPNRELTWSDGPLFSIVNQVRINNQGFVNDQDYVRDGDPLLAVIGDSFVEALMAPYPETLQGRLAQALSGAARVYSFGRSGSPLSQYLAMAEYARDAYAPERYLFVIVGNDFDESLLKYKSASGMHFFEKTDAGARLVRLDYTPGLLSTLAPHSRLLLYLLNNLKITQAAAMLKLRFGSGGQAPFAGNVARTVDQERMEDSLWALDAFLDQLPSATGVDPKRILLVVDGVRDALYSGDQSLITDSFFGAMRRALLERARALGFQVLDLQPVFAREYADQGRPFDFSTNGHWTGYGHGVVARSVLSGPFLDGMRP